MSSQLNRVKFTSTDTGTGSSITVGARYSSAFFTPAQAGAVDGARYTYIIQQGNDVEIQQDQVYTASTTSFARGTPILSSIGGTVGTTKISLDTTQVISVGASAADIMAPRFASVRSVSGTNDTIANSDGFGLVGYNNAASIAATLPQAGASNQFLGGWFCYVRNYGAGVLTITPTTSTISGASSLAVGTGETVLIYSDGTNYGHIAWRSATTAETLQNKTLGTGCVTTTQSPGDNSTKLASTAYVDNVHRDAYDHLINGNGQVNQIVAGSGIADGSYGHDQWVALTQTGSIAVSTLSDVEDGLSNMIRLTQSQASAQRMGYLQPLESSRVKPLRGQAVTLLLRLRNSTGNAIRYAIVEHTGTADTLTKDIVNDWTNGTFTTGNFFTSQSGNITVRSVGSVTPSSNTLTDASLAATLGSTFNNLYVFVWTEGTAAQNSTLDIAANLRRGNASGPVTFRPYDEELDKCERFFQMSYNPGTVPGTATRVGIVGGPTQLYSGGTLYQTATTIYFGKTMRTTPSISYWDGAGNASRYSQNANNGWADNNFNSNVVQNIGMRAFEFYQGTSLSAYIQYTADARL